MILVIEILGGNYFRNSRWTYRTISVFFKKCFMSSLKTELVPIQLDLDKIHEEVRTLSKTIARIF